MTIDIQNRQRRIVGFDVTALKLRARLIESACNITDYDVCATLVSDARIRTLNRDYRHKDKATDVLSFSQIEGEFGDIHSQILGDVIISLETADRQRSSRCLLDEVTHLLIHGVLHLQGHDHEHDADAEVMESEERRIWAAIHANES